MCSNQLSYAATRSPLSESNRRHQPYHGCALPTELRGRLATTYTNRAQSVCHRDRMPAHRPSGGWWRRPERNRSHRAAPAQLPPLPRTRSATVACASARMCASGVQRCLARSPISRWPTKTPPGRWRESARTRGRAAPESVIRQKPAQGNPVHLQHKVQGAAESEKRGGKPGRPRRCARPVASRPNPSRWAFAPLRGEPVAARITGASAPPGTSTPPDGGAEGPKRGHKARRGLASRMPPRTRVTRNGQDPPPSSGGGCQP